MKINKISEGSIVGNGDGTFSRVMLCVHGKKYYGYCGTRKELENQEIEIPTNYIVPDDINKNLVPCCS